MRHLKYVRHDILGRPLDRYKGILLETWDGVMMIWKLMKDLICITAYCRELTQIFQQNHIHLVNIIIVSRVHLTQHTSKRAV